jgi:hypothetical protein
MAIRSRPPIANDVFSKRDRQMRTNSDDHANQECPDIEGHGFLLHHEETTRRTM